MKAIAKVLLAFCWVLIGTAVITSVFPDTSAVVLEGFTATSVGNTSYQLIIDPAFYAVLGGTSAGLFFVLKLLWIVGGFLCNTVLPFCGEVIASLEHGKEEAFWTVILTMLVSCGLVLSTTLDRSFADLCIAGLVVGLTMSELSRDHNCKRVHGIHAVIAVLIPCILTGFAYGTNAVAQCVYQGTQQIPLVTHALSMQDAHFFSTGFLLQLFFIIVVCILYACNELRDWVDIIAVNLCVTTGLVVLHLVAMLFVSTYVPSPFVAENANHYMTGIEWGFAGIGAALLLTGALAGLIVVHKKAFFSPTEKTFDPGP